MPLTFAHPAIVMPLGRLRFKWISITGLIMGSLTPDFEYFIFMNLQGKYGHNIPGLFYFDLPIGLILTFLFHNIVKEALFDNLPAWFSTRFVPFKNFNWNTYFKRHWLAVSACIITGAFTHLFWDAFTHERGYFVELIPGLKQHINLFGIDIPLSEILQHCSTLIGIVVIMMVIRRLPVQQTKQPQRNPVYWFYIAGTGIIIIVIRMISGLGIRQYGNFIVTGIAAVLIGLVITPLIIGKSKTKAGSSLLS